MDPLIPSHRQRSFTGSLVATLLLSAVAVVVPAAGPAAAQTPAQTDALTRIDCPIGPGSTLETALPDDTLDRTPGSAAAGVGDRTLRPNVAGSTAAFNDEWYFSHGNYAANGMTGTDLNFVAQPITEFLVSITALNSGKLVGDDIRPWIQDPTSGGAVPRQGNPDLATPDPGLASNPNTNVSGFMTYALTGRNPSGAVVFEFEATNIDGDYVFVAGGESTVAPLNDASYQVFFAQPTPVIYGNARATPDRNLPASVDVRTPLPAGESIAVLEIRMTTDIGAAQPSRTGILVGVAAADCNALNTSTPPTVADAPTGVTAAAGNGRATVSWTAPANDGGSPIVSYTATATPGGATCTATAPATTCDITGLDNGTAYTFAVVATNAVGASPSPTPSSPVTPAPTVADAPTGVTAAAGDGRATVSWTAPANDGGSPIVSYTATATPGGATCTATAPATTCDITGLDNGTAYTFAVVATNAIGASPSPTPSSPVTLPPTPAASGQGSWVPMGGGAPSVPAGAGELVQADGSRTPLLVSSPRPGQVRLETDGLRITFTGAEASDVSRGLVADADGRIVCEVCGALAAGQVIEAWMFSEPRLVAAHLTEDLECQRFSIPVAAPLDGGGAIPAGAHTLQLALPTASGTQAVNVGVTVGRLIPASIPAGDAPGVPTGRLLLLGLAAACLLSARRPVEG